MRLGKQAQMKGSGRDGQQSLISQKLFHRSWRTKARACDSQLTPSHSQSYQPLSRRAPCSYQVLACQAIGRKAAREINEQSVYMILGAGEKITKK